ncbi:hypothetical protein ACG2LH_00710 [Zhouia sp. PK063]|uniref:hypothetical protein n=1 Tax=Zhouia sp. PK063 TaxID=3373602 RepID=UPI0037BDBE96
MATQVFYIDGNAFSKGNKLRIDDEAIVYKKQVIAFEDVVKFRFGYEKVQRFLMTGIHMRLQLVDKKENLLTIAQTSWSGKKSNKLKDFDVLFELLNKNYVDKEVDRMQKEFKINQFLAFDRVTFEDNAIVFQDESSSIENIVTIPFKIVAVQEKTEGFDIMPEEKPNDAISFNYFSDWNSLFIKRLTYLLS